MQRRSFLTLLGASPAAWPLVGNAQVAGKVWRIGFLYTGPFLTVSYPNQVGFLKGMQDLGYVEDKDFVIDVRSAELQYDRLSELATELVRLNADVLVAGSPPATRALQLATQAIPIVFAGVTDPIGNGFVASLARPGGNITGLASSRDDTAPKQLELLAMVVPNASHIGFFGEHGKSIRLPPRETCAGCREASWAFSGS